MAEEKSDSELPSLAALAEKIERVKQDTVKPAEESRSNHGGMGLAMRMGIEMVSAVLVGTAAGYLLDRWLGTSPWILIVCFFFGSAAGFITLIRTSQAADKQ